MLERCASTIRRLALQTESFSVSLAVIFSAIAYPMADMAADLLAYFGEISARWLS